MREGCDSRPVFRTGDAAAISPRVALLCVARVLAGLNASPLPAILRALVPGTPGAWEGVSAK